MHRSNISPEVALMLHHVAIAYVDHDPLQWLELLGGLWRLALVPRFIHYAYNLKSYSIRPSFLLQPYVLE